MIPNQNRTPSHTKANIVSPKLDKLWRKVVATDAVHSELMEKGEWNDYAVVEKALDNWLKAFTEYWEEIWRIINADSRYAGMREQARANLAESPSGSPSSPPRAG